MQSGTRSWTMLLLILFPVGLMLASFSIVCAGETLVQLTNGDTGKKIGCATLRDGETLILSWTNSLFRLFVTETYIAEGGIIIQTGVTFADPSGNEPPIVSPEDVEDLYHTGGPFKAEGLSLPFRRVVFRIGEIGNPVLKIRDQSIAFAKEVGFGGTVILEARSQLSDENVCR
jgi:hypothetical protein